MQAGEFISDDAVRLKTPEDYACMMMPSSSKPAVTFALGLPYEDSITAKGYRNGDKNWATQAANVDLGNEYCKH